MMRRATDLACTVRARTWISWQNLLIQDVDVFLHMSKSVPSPRGSARTALDRTCQGMYRTWMSSPGGREVESADAVRSLCLASSLPNTSV